MGWELWGFFGFEGLDKGFCWVFGKRKLRQRVGAGTHISESRCGAPGQNDDSWGCTGKGPGLKPLFHWAIIRRAEALRSLRRTSAEADSFAALRNDKQKSQRRRFWLRQNDERWGSAGKGPGLKPLFHWAIIRRAEALRSLRRTSAEADSFAALRNDKQCKGQYGDSGCARMTTRGECGERPGAEAPLFHWAIIRGVKPHAPSEKQTTAGPSTAFGAGAPNSAQDDK